MQNQQSAEYYGLSCQLNQLQEECGELVQVVNKFRRSQGIGQETPLSMKDAFHLLVEEMVDVSIMIEQIEYLLDVTVDEHNHVYKQKIERTQKHMFEQLLGSFFSIVTVTVTLCNG